MHSRFGSSAPTGTSSKATGGPGGEWLVISPDGSEVGWIEVPAGLELVQVTSNSVVGLHRDDLGVESVRVHLLTRR
ncbi:MAG: hypothetical protein VX815_03095 [Gemmatimonadota bacterium]|nr:hypothetical protein [Gemmatimonadota bacterium]